jgi:polyhydroxyalkanoate synthase
MGDQQGTSSANGMPIGDVAALSRSVAEIGERTHRLLVEWLTANGYTVAGSAITDPMGFATSFLDLATSMIAAPGRILHAQGSLWGDFMALWQNTALRMMGWPTAPIALPDAGDRRFADSAWKDHDVFSYILQSYLLTSRWLQRHFREVEGLDPQTRERVEFYTQQFVNALSPSNFAFSNPEVIRATIESCGENLLSGLRNLLVDLSGGYGPPTGPRATDESFEVGVNIAATPGKVVYRNQLMELIQYAPTTETVISRPLLFVPAWINKYYLIDLREHDSWVRWAVDQGHTVFVLSWVNPDDGLAGKSFDEYVLQGPIAALDAITRGIGERQVNAIGYCIGGTLLAATLALLARRRDRRVATATFLSTMLDFSEPGNLGVYIDDATITLFEDLMSEFGFADTRQLVSTFTLLRENDLIWSFVVNNYLLGRDPFPFDLLYWNSDTTRMPRELHRFYLQNFFQRNQLVEPGGIRVDGEPIDLREVSIPCYFLAAREDHIAPWQSIFKGMQAFGGPTRFTLTTSGHVTGVINPLSSGKHLHWTSRERPGADPGYWLATARKRHGSWWPHWDAWVKRRSGVSRVAARQPGAGLEILADAPGAYVRMTA